MYNINHSLNLQNYVDDDKFCWIKTIPGVIDNETIFDQNIVILSFNANKYFSVLNEKSSLSINSNIISNIQNLNNNEILVPSYLKIKYNLQIGDILVLKPKNATMLGNYQIVDNYSAYLSVKGFFNNLPGLDNDNNFNDPYNSQGSLLIITNQDYNYSAEFPNLPIKHTYLIKEFNNSFNTLEVIEQNHSDIQYITLKDGLKYYSTSHLSVSLKFIDVMYTIFVISFIFLTLLFVYNYISENSEFWNLFQLFGLKVKELKRLIFTSLYGILLISFLIGLTGIISGVTVFWFDNLLFKSGYYIYPIQIQFDLLGLMYNFIYLGLSMITWWAINDYMVEYDAELCRKYHYPQYPSRLSAIFAFGDYETCKEVDRKYDWDLSTVKKFRLNIDNLTRVIKVNMEIVSLMRTAYIRGFFDDETKDDI